MMVLLLMRLEEEQAHIMVESNHGFTRAGEALDQQRIRLQVIRHLIMAEVPRFIAMARVTTTEVVHLLI
jgi:hypothetical protein